VIISGLITRLLPSARYAEVVAHPFTRLRAPDDLRPRRERRRSSAATAFLSVGAIALSTWEGGLTRDSQGAHAGVELVGLAAVVAMVVLGWGRQRESTRTWAGATIHHVRPGRSKASVISLLVWGLLIGGVIGWDLLSFIVQSPSFPTLSSLVGHVSHHPIGRGVLFAVWLAMGAYVTVGGRLTSRR